MADIGALALRIEEQGGQAVLARLQAIDTTAKATSATYARTAQAVTAFGTAATRAGSAAAAGAQQAATAEKGLQKEISEGTRLFALQARLIDTTSQTAIAELRASAAAQREWLRSVGASTEQQARFNLAVQQFEQRVRSATAAQQRATTVTTRQAGATRALSGTFTKANGELTGFSKRGLTALNGLAFGFASLAQSADVSLRSIAGQLSGVGAFLGKGGAAFSIASTVALSVFDLIRAAQRRAIEAMALERKVAIQSELTTRKGALDRAEATEQLAYDRGLHSLGEFYAARALLIQQKADAEVKARTDQAAALEAEAAATEARTSRVAGIPITAALREAAVREVAELRGQARLLRAEATAAADQGAAELTRNTGQQRAALLQLQQQALGFASKQLEAQGQGHRARMAQIQIEAQQYDLLLLQQGVSDRDRALAVQRFTESLQAEAAVARELERIEIARTELNVQLQAIQQQLTAGKITELEAARQTTAAEQAALPALREMVARALQFAAALGDQGALASLRELELELDGMGRDTRLDRFLQIRVDPRAGSSVRAAVDKILRDVEEGAVVDVRFLLSADNLVSAAQALDAQFQAVMPGIADVLGSTLSAAFEGGLGKAGNVLLSSLGGLFTQMGQALLTYGLAMEGLLPALINPFTSGPAAIAAGAALLALGGTLSGIATRSGSSGGGASRSSGTRRNPFTGERLQVASGRSQSATSAASSLQGMRASPALAPVVVQTTLLNPNDPASQRILATAISQAQRRGVT